MPQLAQLQIPKPHAQEVSRANAENRDVRTEETDDVLTGRLEVGRQRRVVLEHHDVLRGYPYVPVSVSADRYSGNNNETIKKRDNKTNGKRGIRKKGGRVSG